MEHIYNTVPSPVEEDAFDPYAIAGIPPGLGEAMLCGNTILLFILPSYYCTVILLYNYTIIRLCYLSYYTISPGRRTARELGRGRGLARVGRLDCARDWARGRGSEWHLSDERQASHFGGVQTNK